MLRTFKFTWPVRFALAAVCFAIILYTFFGGNGTHKTENLTITLGKTLVLKLKGKAGPDFRWRLNKTKSSGLELVDIEKIGWTLKPNDHTSLFGTSGILRIAVTSKNPGRAWLVFDYLRIRDEDRGPISTRKFQIEISASR